MKSSRCVLILIYVTNYIVSVNTTNKFKFLLPCEAETCRNKNLNLLVVLTDTI